MATILVVEDRSIDRKFLATLLRTEGHTVVEAADGEEGLSVLPDARPNLVISDILMPTVDGYEFVRRLREIPEVAGTRVMFYTATYHEREARALAVRCGVTAILTKPSEPRAILEAVARALETPAAPARSSDSSDFKAEHLRVVSATLASTRESYEASEQRMAAIVELAHEMAAERDPAVLLQRACDEARRVTLAQHAMLGLLSEDSSTVHTLISTGFSRETQRSLQLTNVKGTALELVVQERRAVRSRNPGGRPDALGFSPAHPPIHAFLAVPLASATRVYGWIGLSNKLGADHFDEADSGVVTALATHAAIGYENARLYEDLQRRAAELESEIAERRRVEQALRASEERTQFTLGAARAGIWEWNIATDAVTWSDTGGVPFGLTQSQLPGTGAGLVERLVHQDDRESFRLAAERAIARRRDLEVEFRTVWPDGSVHWIGTTARVTADPQGNPTHVLGVSTEITERKQLEEQFRHAQKMDAIGHLAGGVAHDFNNLLTAILGYSNLLADALDPNSQHQADVAEIVKAAQRAAGLTKQLLAFSRKQVMQPALVDLNALVRNTSQMLRRIIGEQIDLVTVLAPKLYSVRADPTQIEQIILNLAVNARDAMPSGGRLTIETACVELDEAYILHHIAVTPGRYAMLAVTDNGVGMDDETKRRIFEPFFTTKGPGRGTGLGLATVYGIVKQSRGHIWVYSEPNRGMTFKVYLPMALKTAEIEAPSTPEGDRRFAGSETVLVVEDEDAVRALSRIILERSGYLVLDAKGPKEAEALFAEREDHIGLLITDVVMAGGSGPALYERLAARRPGLRVLYMSGYTDNTVAGSAEIFLDAPFVQKPFTAAGLARKVREVLDG
jgi:PAS domain S-box-containing protein